MTVAEPNPFGPDAGAKTVKAALAAVLKITRPNGAVVRVVANAKWKARAPNESKWKKSTIVAELGDARLDPVPPLPPSAALLRRGFDVTKNIQSARLYVSALGSYRMFLNGRRRLPEMLSEPSP